MITDLVGDADDEAMGSPNERLAALNDALKTKTRGVILPGFAAHRARSEDVVQGPLAPGPCGG